MLKNSDQYIKKLKLRGKEELGNFGRGIKALGDLEKKIVPQRRRYYILWYLGIALFLSFFIPTVTTIFSHLSHPEKWFSLTNYKHTPLLFLSLIPLIVTMRKDVFFKDGPLKALVLIFYYIILIPLLNYLFSGDMKAVDRHEGIVIGIINILNILLLFASHVVLFRYSFTDIFKKRRRIKSSDIVITFLTYITLAISFGFVYFLITISSPEPAFNGLNYNGNSLYFYFQHIYFSFITITTVGYGEISPARFLTQFIVMIEVITGVALLNFSLGITLSSGILNFTPEDENKI